MMVDALKLEWLKFRKYKPFIIILGLFVLTYFAVGISIKSLLDWFLTEQGSEFDYFRESGIPLFDFVDIWQNLGYLTFLFKFFLGFVVIISIGIEYGYKTIRQNFIDGLSRESFLVSKLGLVLFLSLLSGLLLFVLGLGLGLLYSPVKSFEFIVMNLEFVLAYILEVFAFLSFAMLVAILIRRTGFAIVLFTIYAIAIEPIIAAVMQYNYELPVWYLPIRAINNLISVPFPKYIFKEVQDVVLIQDVGVVLAWTTIFCLLSLFLIRRRDA